jgi:hydroxyacylglutathione hydrolase
MTVMVLILAVAAALIVGVALIAWVCRLPWHAALGAALIAALVAGGIAAVLVAGGGDASPPVVPPAPPAVVEPAPAPALPPVVVTTPSVVIRRHESACNSWIVSERHGSATAVVDPSPGIAEVVDALNGAGLRPVTVWITHGHGDHVAGLAEFTFAAGAAAGMVRAHTEAVAKIRHDREHWEEWWGEMSPVPPPLPNLPTAHHADFVLGGLSVRALHVPGHSPGSLCYLISGAAGPEVLIAGDVLFRRSIGRTDFEDGDPELFGRGLAAHLWPLPDDVAVFPGHGPHTTIGAEKRENWLFQDFVRRAEGLPAIPRPWIGVRPEPAADGGGLVFVEITPGSSAADAGLEPGDICTAINGEPVVDVDGLLDHLFGASVGDSWTLTILRDGEAREITLNLKQRPVDPPE